MPRPACQAGEAAERLELQEPLSRCLWYPKVFPLKFTEIFLGKHSAFGLLLFCLLWRLILGLPASVLSKNLQTIQRWKKQQSLLSRPNHKTVIFKLTCSIPAVLQEPCYFPECLQRKVRGKPLMLTKAGHWDNSRYQLIIWSQIWKLFSIIVTEIRTLISIQNFLKLWPSFYPLSPWHNPKTQRVCGIPSAFSNTLSPPVTISSLRNTGLNHFHLSMYVNCLYLIKTAQGSSTVSYSSLQILAWDYLLGKTTQEILKLWDTPFKRQSNSYYMSQQHICFLVNQPPATEKASLIDRVRRRSEPGLLCQLKLRNIFGN